MQMDIENILSYYQKAMGDKSFSQFCCTLFIEVQNQPSMIKKKKINDEVKLFSLSFFLVIC